MTISFYLWFPSYFCEQIVKFCKGSKVSSHYYVGSMSSCSMWVVLTGLSSTFQRKHPWEERTRTDIWDDRRYPLLSALSVCRASAFPASLVHAQHLHTPKVTSLSRLSRDSHQPDSSSTVWQSNSRAAWGAALHRRPALLTAISSSRCPSCSSFLVDSFRDVLAQVGVGKA